MLGLKTEWFFSWEGGRIMDDPPKLFQLPRTIEEEEERELESYKPRESLENASKVESPLLGQKGALTISSLPRNVTLIRVSTQSSSIAGGIGRQDSTRWGSTWVKLFYPLKIYLFVEITKILLHQRTYWKSRVYHQIV